MAKAKKGAAKKGAAKKGAARGRGVSPTMAAVRGRMADRQQARVRQMATEIRAGRRGFDAPARSMERAVAQPLFTAGRGAAMFGANFTPQSGRRAGELIREARVAKGGGASQNLLTLENRLLRGKPLTMKQAALAARLTSGGAGGGG